MKIKITIALAVLAMQASAQNYVDLGLPSHTLWADRNIEAESETDNGASFVWGNSDDEAKSRNKYKGNAFYSVPSSSFKYVGLSWQIYNVYRDMSDGYIPTRMDWAELFRYCKREWKVNYKGTGRSGLLFTGKNGNSIFIVATGIDGKHQDEIGHYYSAELYERESRKTAKSHPIYLLSAKIQCGTVNTDCSLYTGKGIYMRPIKK